MSSLDNLCSTWKPRLLSIMRIMVGLMYLQHGLNKILNFPPTATHHAYQVMTLVPGLAGLIETIGGILIVLGLFTRPVAFICSGEMAVAYFLHHAPGGFFPLLNGGERAVVYCFVFLFLSAAGGGPWSVDAARSRPSAGA